MSKTLNRTGKTIIADQVIELIKNDDDELLASVEENSDYTAFASAYNIVVSGVFSTTKTEPAKVYFNINYNGEPLPKGENGVLFGTSVIVRGTNRDGNAVTTRQYVVGTFDYIEVPIELVAFNGAPFVLEWTGGINGVQRILRADFSIEYGTVTQYAFSSATTEEEIKAQELNWTYTKPSATESNLTMWSRESDYYDYETGEYTNWTYFKLQEPYLSISPSQSFIQLSSRGVVTKDQTITFYAISNSSERPTWYVDDVLISDESTGRYTINSDGNLVANIEANNQPIRIMKVSCTLSGVTATVYMNGTATETPTAGLVTENFVAGSNEPSTYLTGEPLIDGDFAFGEVTDGTSTFTEVFRYTIDELGNGSWSPVKPDDDNYAQIILGCLDYITNSPDTQKEVKALTGWFQNLFAKRAVIEQIETMGITLQDGGVIKSKNYDRGNGAGFYLDGDSGNAVFREVEATGGRFDQVTITGEVTTKVLLTQNDNGGLEGGATANSLKAPFGYDRRQLYDSMSPLLQKVGELEDRYTGNYGSNNFNHTIFLSSDARTLKRTAIDQQSVSDGTVHSFTPSINTKVYNECVPYKKAYTVEDYYTSSSTTYPKNQTTVPSRKDMPDNPKDGDQWWDVYDLITTYTYTYGSVTEYTLHKGYRDSSLDPIQCSDFSQVMQYQSDIPSPYPYVGYYYTTYTWQQDYMNNVYYVYPVVHVYYEEITTKTYYNVTYDKRQTSGSGFNALSNDGDKYYVFYNETANAYYSYTLTVYTFHYSSSTGTKDAIIQYSANGNDWYTFNDPVNVNYGATFYVRQKEPSAVTGHTTFTWGAVTAGKNIVKATFEPYSAGISFLNANRASVGNINSTSAVDTTVVTVKDGDTVIRRFNGTSSVVGFTLYGRFGGVTPTDGDFTEFTTFTACRWKQFGKNEVIINKSDIRRVTWNANNFYATKNDLKIEQIDQSMWLSSVNISFVPIDTYPAVYTQNIYPFKDGNYNVGDGNQPFNEMHANKFEGGSAVFHEPNGIRLVYGSQSFIIRYDGSYLYILPSDKIVDGDNWTSARPLMISNDGVLYSNQINSAGTGNVVFGACFN